MVIMLVAVALTLISCSSKRKSEQQARNDAEAAAIQAELSKIPGVAKVEVLYSNYITDPGSGSANLRVEEGTDMEHIADLAAEAIWRSRLEPLNTISVRVGGGEGGSPSTDRDYLVGNKDDPDDNTVELEAKYGPRPVEAR